MAQQAGSDRPDGRSYLTDRQRQVAQLFCAGMTYREVAAECGISPETVNPTLKAVAAKLGAGKRIARAVLRPLLEQASAHG